MKVIPLFQNKINVEFFLTLYCFSLFLPVSFPNIIMILISILYFNKINCINRNNKWFKIYIIFIIYITINSKFNSYFLSNTFFSFAMIRYPIFALILSSLSINTLKFYKIMKYFSFIIIFDSMLQYIFGFNLLLHYISVVKTGEMRLLTFSKKACLGYLTMSVFLSVLSFEIDLVCSKIKNQKNIRDIIISLVYILFFSLVILLSGERIAFAWFSIFLCFLFFFLLNKHKLLNLQSFIITTLTLISIFIFVINQKSIKARIYRSIHQTSSFFESPYGKIIILGNYAIKNNLFFGVGTNNLRYVSKAFDQETKIFQNIKHPPVNHLHNIYLEILSEQGIFGFILFVMFIFCVVFDILRKLQNDKNLKYDPIFIANIMIFIYFIFPINITSSVYIINHVGSIWFSIGMMYRQIYRNKIHETSEV